MKTVLRVLILSAAVTVLCLWIQPNAFRTVAGILAGQPLLILLNVLPVLLTVSALTSLMGNAFTAAGISGVIWGLLSLANTVKMQVRDEPLFPRDFALLKEAASAVRSYQIQWPWKSIAMIVLWLVLMLLLAYTVGRHPSTDRPDRLRQAIGAGIAVLALVGCIRTVYASNDLYNSFSTSNPYYVPAVFNELGFPYCFCHHFTTYAVDKPDGFQKDEAEDWDTASVTDVGQKKNVSVVMVMNEAFSDVTDQSVFDWASDDDPLHNLHTLQESLHAVSGHIVVPGFAGGTANTEFDVLTGMQTNALSATTTSAFRVVNRNLDSLFRVFGGDGYRTEFLHPGDAWFYNRENVYRWFGADTILFAQDMEPLSYKGRWVTDDSMADQIIRHLDSAAVDGTPLFHYTVTIQNHMSYTVDKYGDGYVYPSISTTAELSDAARALLTVYTEGVRDADAMLGRLADDIASRSEPVVLLFFGDHLPYLGDDMLAYRELGLGLTPEEGGQDSYLQAYETPYVLWANDAAAEILDWESAVDALDLPSDGRISACYLGALILQLTGHNNTPWFQFLDDLRRELPVIQRQTFVTKKDSIVSELDPILSEKVRQFRCWSYYKLQYKTIPS